jgi:hypothetical protein
MGTNSFKRRLFLIAPMLPAFLTARAEASPINPCETFELQPDQIRFKAWDNGPPGGGEMAMLYGDLNRPGPYLVMMKWYPEWSVRHTTTELTVFVW